MMLEGIGDPSNGHGGYSYLKLPLKIFKFIIWINKLFFLEIS